MTKKTITIGTPKKEAAGVGAFGNKICHFAGKKKEKKSVGVRPKGRGRGVWK
jgi:hypothetical protein